jgi:hypothetical protein
MSLILDAGALVAIDRDDRAMWRRLKTAHTEGQAVRSHGGIVGQVWRGRSPRHARLSMALAGLDIQPLDYTLGRAAGELLAITKTRDVIDAALVLLSNDGDEIVTSDVHDLEVLAIAAGRHVDIIRA